MRFSNLEGGACFIKTDDTKYPQAFLFRKLIETPFVYKVQTPTSDGGHLSPTNANAIMANGTLLIFVLPHEEIIWIK